MSKFIPHLKSLALYWSARREHARRKYRQAVAALDTLPSRSATAVGGRPTVLIFSSIGVFADHLVVDTLLAKALEREGARVVVVLCDGVLPACHVADRYSYAFAVGAVGRARRQARLCEACRASTTELVRDSGLTYSTFSEGIAHARMVANPPLTLDLADDINAGVIRFAASSHSSILSNLPEDIKLAYTRAALIAQEAVEGLIAKYQPSTIIAHHGIYVPQGVVQKLAKQHKIRFYSWHFGYRKSTLIFSRGDTYHRELTADQPAAFEKRLYPDQRERIDQYLKTRLTGAQDWIHFNRQPKPFDAAFGERKYFVFYSSVDWDAALHFPASVFRSQFHLIEELVELFRETPQYDLVIRIHPAEVTGFHPAALSAKDHLRTLDLPVNVHIVGANDKTSSYDLAKGCLAAIVYNTKLGIELPPLGIPTIVAGDCWIRGKGFSYDVDRPDDLRRYVHSGEVLCVSDEQRERALQFAYYFYFRRCIDTPELTSTGPKFQIGVDERALARSFDEKRGLSFIASCVLNGEQVVTD